ncbi:MAG: AIR synthase [Tissierellia bacterium]|nr:AIR synthase [Tissierellia bacterium]
MEIGKIPNEILQRIAFNNTGSDRKDVLVGAGIGEDNAIMDFGDEICVISTDPITGATKDIGKLAITISCNDVASSGAEPIGVLITILAPPKTTEQDIRSIMEEADAASRELNIEIMGGHTEVTDAVTRMVISTTVVGKQPKKNMIDPSKTKVGDKVLISKHVGIEGTSIIAKELGDYLEDKMDRSKIEMAKAMGDSISVLKEGLICGEIGVRYMHDITEGGVLGAIWEGAMAVDMGIRIHKDLIPIKEITEEISSILDIDPYRLISSGSMMIVAEESKVGIIEDSLAREDIDVTVIGEVIEDGIFIEEDGIEREIEAPGSDELYRALSILE